MNCLDESDDERTIAKEDILESDVGEETADLAKESEMDLDELLASVCYLLFLLFQKVDFGERIMHTVLI